MPVRTYPRATEGLMKPKRHNSMPTTPQTSADASGTSNPRIGNSTERTSSTRPTESGRRHHHRQTHRTAPSKQDQPKRESLPSPPPSQHQHHGETSYAHTTHSHTSLASHYQLTSTPSLPSATRWPHQYSVAARGRMDDDLLGLDLSQPSYTPYSMTTRIPEEEFECASDLMGSLVGANAGFAGGVGGYTAWRTEAGAIFAWDHDGNSSAGTGYTYDFVNSIDDTVADL